jgi:hypothetical protein
MGLRLPEGATSTTFHVPVLPGRLLRPCLELGQGRVRASGVVFARCFSRIIAARISAMVKFPVEWRVDECPCAFKLRFGRVRSERLKAPRGGNVGGFA